MTDIHRHLGIRFAEPPVGPRRWRPPAYIAGAEPLGHWPVDCPQPVGASSTRAPAQDEDCLFLNVWSPTDDPDAGLPVLVWFYGGSFLFGSASDPTCDGERLARRGVVVVTANYRVGLLGYLAHPGLTAESAEGSSGNYGLLDALAALRWVAEHIDRYGGDPERITAFGVSAGSASLALLQTSPLAVGRFHRLVLQSPGAWRPLASLAEAEAEALAAYGDDVDVLRGWSAGEVLDQSAKLVPRVRGLTSPRLMRPISDGWVVPEPDRDAYRAGRFAAVPTIVGGNLDEGGALTAAWLITTVDQYRELVEANFGPWSDEAFHHYPARSDDDVRGAMADLFGDTQFTYGARGIAIEVARRQPAVHRYLYTHRAPGCADGPSHGDEVAGLFAGAAPTGAAMADAWVRFAATADPNGGAITGWDSYDPALDNHLAFDDPPTPGRRWRADSLDFLDRYYDSAAPAPAPLSSA